MPTMADEVYTVLMKHATAKQKARTCLSVQLCYVSRDVCGDESKLPIYSKEWGQGLEVVDEAFLKGLSQTLIKEAQDHASAAPDSGVHTYVLSFCTSADHVLQLKRFSFGTPRAPALDTGVGACLRHCEIMVRFQLQSWQEMQDRLWDLHGQAVHERDRLQLECLQLRRLNQELTKTIDDVIARLPSSPPEAPVLG